MGSQLTKDRTPAGAMLRYLSRGSFTLSIALLWKVMDRISIASLEEDRYSGMGPPHNPPLSIVITHSMVLIDRGYAEEGVIDTLRTRPKARKRARLRGKSSINPSQSLLSRFRNDSILGGNALLHLREEAARLAGDMEVMDGRAVMIDSYPVNLCEKCKLRAGCPWVVEGKWSFPDGCLKDVYEGAKPAYKSKDERYVGYKKHCAIDLQSGRIITSILTPANVNDGKMAIPLLRKLMEIGIYPLYVIMDSQYDWEEIYRFILYEMNAMPITSMNERGAIADIYPLSTEGGKVVVDRKGTPLCPAYHTMRFSHREGKMTHWSCDHPSHNGEVKLILDPSLDPRRICPIPRCTEEWWKIYRLRKLAEQPFSILDGILDITKLKFEEFYSIEFYSILQDIILLMSILLAHMIGLRGMVRDIKEVHAAVQSFLYGRVVLNEDVEDHTFLFLRVERTISSIGLGIQGHS